VNAPLKPFANETQSLILAGDLSVENGVDVVTLSGSLEITRDKVGLARAKELQAILAVIVSSLEADASLPAEITVKDEKPTYVPNPFGS
jgi:O-succinylbenzoate synthase